MKKPKKTRVCSRRNCQNEIPGRGKFCSIDCGVFSRNKTVSSMKKIVWILYSKKIKHRDTKDGYFTCFSCRKYLPVNKFQAGHFKHGDNVGTWINPKNVHAQCIGCNMFMNGNRDNYALWLCRTYGPDILEELDKAYHSSPQTWTMEMLRDKYKELKYDSLTA